MSLILVELRPDRDLLDPSFGGYKLSLDSIPVYKKNLSEEIGALKLSKNQYSFLHVKLFSLHNHLYSNPHATDQVFIIDKTWKVHQITLTALHQIDSLKEVCQIPNSREKQEGDYNVSLVFASEGLVVLADGGGALHIASVDLPEGEPWDIRHSDVPCGDGVRFVIADAKVDNSDSGRYLHVVLSCIEEKEETSGEKQGICQTVLEWFRYKEGANLEWTKEAQSRIICDGSIEHLSLESECSSLLVIANKTPTFVFDSENPIQPLDTNVDGPAKVYVWNQTSDDITVTFATGKDITKQDIQVRFEEDSIDIQVKEKSLLSGKLKQRIDKNLSTWVLEGEKLEVQLMKEEIGRMWDVIVIGDDRGEYVPDPRLVEEVHRRLAHLCSDQVEQGGGTCFDAEQLEECDASSADTLLLRLDRGSHRVTHQASLSSLQWLFKVHQTPDKTPAMCLRHDVDACVWQFERLSDSVWPNKHVSTFFAFGYVQASKTQKKFIVSPPDCSYVAICDVSRHVYLYRQPSVVQGDLRNRATGRRVEAVAKQQLVNLETNDEILGAYATNSLLYVLTNNTIQVLVVNP